ncbi:ATP-binding cassette sub-family C member 2-like [Oppia nitens]|uniref:ATP-binding cassette sub-family C member 2-like n=1 Tax=Oppia nitens TaxID=1686743 RepID=UPI0023D9B589|nr:ATP-binding cassette sub-family C member 2-like [Oppia nitens]
MYGLDIIGPIVLLIVAYILQTLQALIFKLLIDFIDDKYEYQWHGYVYSIMLITINIFYSLFYAYSYEIINTVGIRVKSCLTAAIYRKALVLSNDSKRLTPNGEIVNLMTVDCQRIIDNLHWAPLIFTTPVQICLAIYLIYQQLGVAAFVGLGVLIAVIPISFILTVFNGLSKQKQFQLKDSRLNKMNEILNGIKILKLYAWEIPYLKMVNKIRNRELRHMLCAGLWLAVTLTLTNALPMVAQLATFGTFSAIEGEDKINAQRIFVSVSLFSLANISIVTMPYAFNSMSLIYVSIKRIDKFLKLPEHYNYVQNNDNKQFAVTVDMATFSWMGSQNDLQLTTIPTKSTTTTTTTNNNNIILKDINLDITNGMFVAVVGGVGSGKSSLLSALIGDMELIGGSVNIAQDQCLAYVPQQSWILNATLKDNILFGKPYDPIKYSEVVSACALQPDLRQLSGGDETEIGEKGINLSGGQKQRVSLCRAVYSDADIYLFDDPLSAVDSHVGKHIMTEVFSSRTGLLREKTRILVTNQLFVLPDVDLIVVLKDGSVAAIGTYEQLLDNNKEFNDLVAQYSVNNRQQNNQEEDEDMLTDGQLDSTGSIDNKSTTIVSTTVDTTGDQPFNMTPVSNSMLINEEHLESGVIKFGVYIKYIRSMSIILAVMFLISLIGATVCQISVYNLLSKWTSDITTKSKTQYYLSVLAAMIVLFIVLFLVAVISLVAGVRRAAQQLHGQILDCVMHAPMTWFDTTPLGRILNRFSRDLDVLDGQISDNIGEFFVEILSVIGGLINISILMPLFSAPVIVAIILYVLFQLFYLNISRQLKRLESTTRSRIISHFEESVNGLSSVRAYRCSDRFVREIESRLDANQMCLYPNVMAISWLQTRLAVLSNLLIFFGALFAVLARDQLTGGSIGLTLSLAIALTPTLENQIKSFTSFENCIVSVERVDEYTRLESEADWHSTAIELPANWPSNGSVRFDGYGARYRPGLDLVLRGIDVCIKPREKIGIVGRTGAGKSSLTLALFRIIEPAMGNIIIDDIDISRLGLQELRSRLTIIPQEPVLYSGTIRSNLDPFGNHTDSDLWSVLEQSHLKQFVQSLDSQLDSPVAKSGDNLSVGQRQLVCLARALLRHTSVLILDEATAAVDVETDALIQQTIRQEFSSSTVLTIAHRINTIMDSDRVIVFNNGRVAEFDEPDVLLANKSNIFYTLASDAGII